MVSTESTPAAPRPTPSPDEIIAELVEALSVHPTDAPDRFAGQAPDWFGERVFGGLVVGQGLAAAVASVEGTKRAHSLHSYFLGALRPGPVELEVERLRDGRAFTTRHVRTRQGDRVALWQTVSFHDDEGGVPYQLAMPDDVPGPDEVGPVDDPMPPFDIHDVGPTERRADGTYASTRRCWVRPVAPLPDDPRVHLLVGAFLSDLTGTSFRPHNLGEWGTHTDASIDHAAWFHRPPRFDDWTYMDFHAVVNEAGRSTVRGAVFDRDGALILTMAQELLIRPVDGAA